MQFRSLLVGSAALFAASAGAMAQPVEYVRVCDAFGAGFYYIPGTEVCLRVDGRVRVDASYADFGDEDDVEVFTDLGTYDDFNPFNIRAKGDAIFDARTQTNYGTLRAYLNLQALIGMDDFDTAIGVDQQDFIRSAFMQWSSIDLGTFTVGHTASFFDFWGSDGYGSRLNIDDSTANVPLFGWTYARRGGISFSAAIEAPSFAAAEYPTFLGGENDGRILFGDERAEEQDWPDIVGNIRIDQGWGSGQVMTALRHNSGPDGDGLGIALGAGGRVFAPGGWEISGQVGYANGALGYVTNDWGPNYAFAGGFDRYGIGDLYGTSGEDTNHAWSVRAGVVKSILPNLDAWANVSYTFVEQGDATNPAQDGPEAGDDYKFWAAVAGFAWEPIDGLSVGPEVAYNHVRGDDPDEEGDIFSVMVRATYRLNNLRF
jgi:hypothetical protein